MKYKLNNIFHSSTKMLQAEHIKELGILTFILTFIIILAQPQKAYDTASKLRRTIKVIYETTAPNPYTRKICLNLDKTLRAKKKTCFLRPDTGPCRADIVQWYFDVKKNRCYRFFYGGCQGNGNKFETHEECKNFCFVNMSDTRTGHFPNYCMLAFDYGTCFGYFNRWSWDKYAKTCKERLYSGCGGNQNNFETYDECFKNCARKPNNTLHTFKTLTTCIPLPFNMPGVI